MSNLRIFKHLVDRVDRSARHAGGIQMFDPVVTGLVSENAGEGLIEFVAMLDTRGIGAEARIRNKIIMLDGGA